MSARGWTARAVGLLAVLALAAAAFGACSRGAPRYDGPVRTLVVVSLDTLRADHVGAYRVDGGPGDGTGTPRLDALAREGVVLEDVTTAAPTTLAAHVSLVTATWPQTHGVPRNGFTIAPENETLAEHLSARGFASAAFLGSFALDRRFGFDQGFAHFDQDFDRLADVRAADQDQRRAAAVTDAALGWLDGAGRAAERRFLFVHYFDAHGPFDAPDAGAPHASLDDLRAAVSEHQAALLGGPSDPEAFERTILEGLSTELLARADGRELALDRRAKAAYAAEVRYLDRELGRLVDGLAARGLLEGALIALVADHGESFHEHADFWNHGLWAYQTTAHVPCIVWRSSELRGAGEAGRRVATPVSSIDVVPTLLELAGIDALPRAEGTSLAGAVARGEPLARGPVFCEATQPMLAEDGPWANASKPAAVREGSLKLIEAPLVGWRECFDLASDPLERENLCAAGLDARFARLVDVLARHRAAARPLPSAFDRSQIEETIERLRQLGYPGGAEQDEPREPPAPGDRRPR